MRESHPALGDIFPGTGWQPNSVREASHSTTEIFLHSSTVSSFLLFLSSTSSNFGLLPLFVAVSSSLNWTQLCWIYMSLLSSFPNPGCILSMWRRSNDFYPAATAIGILDTGYVAGVNPAHGGLTPPTFWKLCHSNVASWRKLEWNETTIVAHVLLYVKYRAADVHPSIYLLIQLQISFTKQNLRIWWAERDVETDRLVIPSQMPHSGHRRMSHTFHWSLHFR